MNLFGTHQRCSSRLGGDDGFTLIELLVVMLIIGILAAIAIPSFITQSAKADDAQAKALARNAATTMETYGTDHSGDFSGALPATLTSIEAAINSTSNTKTPYVSALTATANSYSITVSQPITSDTFTIVNNAGAVTRSCTGTGGGCANATW